MTTLRDIAVHEAGHVFVGMMQNMQPVANVHEGYGHTDYMTYPEWIAANTPATMLRTLAGVAAEMEFLGTSLKDVGGATDLNKTRTYARWMNDADAPTRFLTLARKLLRAHANEVMKIADELERSGKYVAH